MSSVLVDSNVIIDALNGQPATIAILEDLAPQRLAVSLISYCEVFEGAYYASDPATKLDALQTFLEEKDLVPLSTAVMERFAVVRGRLSRHLRRQIGDMDILIAATALTHDLVLLTRNLRDFDHIPNLKLYQLDSMH